MEKYDTKIENALNSFKKGDYKAAIKDFEEANAETPNNPSILNNLGLCYANLADNERAEAYYLEALKLDSKLVQTYVNLSDIYYKEKKIIDGINLLETAVTLMPENTVLKNCLARFYIEDVRYDLAINELSEILDMEPENVDAAWDLANVLFETGDYESAISNYEIVLEKITDNPVMYFQAASACEAADELDKAVSYHLKAVSYNPDFYPSYKKLGILFSARGDKESAIEYFEEYLKYELPDDEKKTIEGVLEKLKK